MKISVHLDSSLGEPCHAKRCALALALNNMGIECGVGLNQEGNYTISAFGWRLSYPITSRKLIKWLNAFDNGKKPEPGTFNVEVPSYAERMRDRNASAS